MLPPESIRFFYVDSNWLEALVDGAFSIGVHSERDIRYDKVMQHAIREATLEASGKLRSGLRGEAGENTKETSPVRAGFLMRSAIVSGWPGLEICGYSTSDEPDEDDNTKLKLLRLDRLSPDVLLCIFEDIPKKIVIHEPAESFHFGVTSDNGDTIVRLRDPDNGERLNLNNDKDVVVLPTTPSKGKAEGVLDIKALYEEVSKKLTTLKNEGTIKIDLGKAKANFAVQMIDAADKQPFVADGQGGA